MASRILWSPIGSRRWARIAGAAFGVLLLVSAAGVVSASSIGDLQFQSDAARTAARDRRIRELRVVSVEELSQDQLDELVRLLNERAHWREPVDHVVVYGGAALGGGGLRSGGGGVRAGSLASRSRNGARSGSLASRSRRDTSSSRSSSSRQGSSLGSSSGSSFGSSSGSSFGSSSGSSFGSSSNRSSSGSSFGSSSLGSGMH
jgi:hypothetical protein